MIGIVCPALSNRFTVVLKGVADDIAAEFARNLVSASFDFVNRTLTVRVRQTILCKSLEAIKAVGQTEMSPDVSVLDGAGAHLYFMRTHGRLTEHTVDFTYASGDAVTHVMVWSLR